MTWLHFLKDCAWINKMLNASIKSLSTIHYSLSTKPCPRPAVPIIARKNGFVDEDEPRMDTNRHEDRWTSLNDKRHQNASAIFCPWCDFVSLVDNPLNWFQPRMRRPHVAVGVSPWNSGAPKVEPRRWRQRVASGRQPRATRRRRPVRVAPHLHRLRMEFRPPTWPEVVWGRPQRHTGLCARLSPSRRKSRNRRKTRRRSEGCPGSHWRWN